MDPSIKLERQEVEQLRQQQQHKAEQQQQQHGAPPRSIGDGGPQAQQVELAKPRAGAEGPRGQSGRAQAASQSTSKSMQSAQRKRSAEQRRKMPSGELIELSIRLSDEILAEAVGQYGELRTLERLLALLGAHQRGGLNFSPLPPASRLGLFTATAAAASATTVPQRETGAAATAAASGRQQPTGSAEQTSACATTSTTASVCPLCAGSGNLRALAADEQQALKLVSAAVSVALASIGSIKFQSTVGVQAQTLAIAARQGSDSEWRFNRFLEHLISSRALQQASDKLSAAAPAPAATAPAALRRQSQQPQKLAEATAALATTTTTTGTQAGGSSLPSLAKSEAKSAEAGMQGETKRRPPNEPPPPPETHLDGLGQLLANLRQERERLACQVGRLELRLSELELDLERNHQSNSRHPRPSEPQAGDQSALAAPPHGSSGNGSGDDQHATAATAMGGRPLLKSSSSSIQRMKRMDTLKRRKIKREQQQQQQQQQQQEAGSPASLTSSCMAQDVFGPPSTADDTPSPARPPRPPPVSGGGGGGSRGPSATREPILELEAEQEEASEPAPVRPAQASGPTQLYQSVRLSLANLLGEPGSQSATTNNSNQQAQRQQSQDQQQQQQKRKRFSLSAFGTSFSAALGSPFASPKKGPLSSESPRAAAQGALQKLGAASRSQSSCSSAAVAAGGAPGAMPQASPQSRPATSGQAQQASNNCSCLRSSGSSQSVESLADPHNK